MNDDISYQEHEDAEAQERDRDLQEHMNAASRKILDEKYLIVKTIGEGRYAK
jgi:hypothetical protein